MYNTHDWKSQSFFFESWLASSNGSKPIRISGRRIAEVLSLSMAQEREQYTVKWNTCDLEFRKATELLGLVTGAELSVLSSYFGNVIVLIEGRRVALSREVAERIKV